MRSIHGKLTLFVIIMSIIPMFALMFYYYDIKLTGTWEETDEETRSQLVQIDNELAFNLNRIQIIMDEVVDEELYRLLSETDSANKEDAVIQDKLDRIYAFLTKSMPKLESVLLFPVSGGTYVAGEPLAQSDPRQFMIMYDSIKTDNGALSWLGFRENIEQKHIVGGLLIRDKGYQKNNNYLASMYIVFNKDLFLSDSAHTDVVKTDGDISNTALVENNVFIYDKAGNLIYCAENGYKKNLIFDAIQEGRLFDENKSTAVVNVENSKQRIIIHTSMTNGWKYVRVVSYELYQKLQRNILYTIFSYIIVLLIVWLLASYFIIKRIVKPIQQLKHAMRRFCSDNFEVCLPIESKDEFGNINADFNEMARKTKSLFERIHEMDRKMREQEILALKYQINPHFLYNTLSSIRMHAMIDGQVEVSKMLLITSRFLRNAISNVNEMIDIKREIENIKDYLELMQIRHCNKLIISIDNNEAYNDYLLPAMLCQPIIENSIIHGLHDRIKCDNEPKLNIRVYEEDEFLIISIFDNGCGIADENLEALFDESNSSLQFKKTDSIHIGLLNVHKRIKMLFGNEYGLDVVSVEDEYTLVKIRLPQIKNTSSLMDKECNEEDE